MTWRILSLLLLPACGPALFAAPPPVDFEQQVWPVLERHCLECHNARQRYANLRLDSRERILRGGDLGEVLIPGEPDESSLYGRTILPRDDLDFMPVDNEPLSEEEKEILRRWIAEGADFGDWQSAGDGP